MHAPAVICGVCVRARARVGLRMASVQTVHFRQVLLHAHTMQHRCTSNHRPHPCACECMRAHTRTQSMENDLEFYVHPVNDEGETDTETVLMSFVVKEWRKQGIGGVKRLLLVVVVVDPPPFPFSLFSPSFSERTHPQPAAA